METLSREAKVFIDILDNMKEGWACVTTLPITSEFVDDLIKKNRERYLQEVREKYGTGYSEACLESLIRSMALPEALDMKNTAVDWFCNAGYLKETTRINKYGVKLRMVTLGKRGLQVEPDYRRAGTVSGRIHYVKRSDTFF